MRSTALFRVLFLSPIAFALLALHGACTKSISRTELEAITWDIKSSRLLSERTDAFGREHPVPMPHGFFRFYGDGQASRVHNATYRAGRWSWNPKSSTLDFEGDDGFKEQIIVERVEPTGFLFEVTSRDIAVAYRVAAGDPSYGDIDIYSPAANTWRIPASHAQSPDEITQRLRAMLAFLKAYFENAAIRSAQTVEVASLPTPFIFAANGVAIYDTEHLPEKWASLFSSREEAEDATLLLTQLFDGAALPHTPNRFERNALIFTQLAERLAILSGQDPETHTTSSGSTL